MEYRRTVGHPQWQSEELRHEEGVLHLVTLTANPRKGAPSLSRLSVSLICIQWGDHWLIDHNDR